MSVAQVLPHPHPVPAPVATASVVPAPRCRSLTVSRVQEVTPHLRRITLHGDQLEGFTGRGSDQFVRLLLPRRDQVEPLLPTSAHWRQELLALDPQVRPVLRNYTVAALRPAEHELDVDVVLHGDEGPASVWAMRVQPGARVGVLEQGAHWTPAPGAAWQLLAGDETALPAVAAILRELPAGAIVHVVLEVPELADRQPLPAPCDVAVTWLPRAERGAAPGELLAAAVAALDLPDGEGRAWVAGEAGAVQQVRQHLLHQRGLAREAVHACAYWRRDRPANNG